MGTVNEWFKGKWDPQLEVVIFSFFLKVTVYWLFLIFILAIILSFFSFLRYSVNVGSVHKFSNAAALSLINTHLSVCASILSWVIVMYITTKRLKIMDLLQGIIVGLVGMFAWSFSNSLIIHQAKTKQITTAKEV